MAKIGGSSRIEAVGRMMRDEVIVSVQAVSFSVPLAAEFRIAPSALVKIDNVAVRVELACGMVGWGETSILQPLTVEDQALAVETITTATEWLTGQPATAWRRLSQRLQSEYPNYPSVRAGIEMALFDALARYCRLPLYQFFGGATSKLQTDITIPICDPDTARALAADYRGQGFTTLKIKVGDDLDQDLARLRAIHASFSDCRLVLDGNGGFGADQAVDRQLAVVDIKPALFEQPVPRDDLDGLRWVHQQTNILVAADALRIVEQRVAQVINIKLVKTGVVQALDIAAIARSAGVGLMIGGMVETRLAMGFGAHFAAGLGGFDWIDLDTPLLLAEDPVQGGYTACGPVYDLDTGETGHGGSLNAVSGS